LFSVAVLRYHDQKTTWKEKRAYFNLQIILYHQGKTGQELKAGTWWQELKQRLKRRPSCWLAFHGLHSQLSYTDQDHLPKGGTIHSHLGTFTPIIN
jgi:predicted TIM-barrel fold metal-dependent hydrolase